MMLVMVTLPTLSVFILFPSLCLWALVSVYR